MSINRAVTQLSLSRKIGVIPSGATPVASTLEIVSGGNQSATVGQSLPQPLVVRVRDQNNAPFLGRTLAASVNSGGGAISPSSATTDANGLAAFTATVGAAAGFNSFTVTGVGLSGSPAVFTATGVSAASGVSLASLPTTGTRNLTAYNNRVWYNPNGTVNGTGPVRLMPAGCYYLEPTSGVRVWRVGSPTFPAANAGTYNLYSTQGLHVSQKNNGKHTLAFIANPVSGGTPWLCDFDRTLGPHNYRANIVPFDVNGSFCFSRLPGETNIAYRYGYDNRVRKYDFVAGVELTQAPYPLTWVGPIPFWFQQTDDGTWFTAQQNGAAVYAINPNTGQTRVLSAPGMDEHYIVGGSNWVLVAVSQSGVGAGILWNLDTDQRISVDVPTGAAIINHVPSMTGSFLLTNTEAGGGVTPIRRLTLDGVLQPAVNLNQYLGQYHWCGHWRNGSGTQQYALASLWQDTNAPNTVGPWPLSLTFCRLDAGDNRVLGHSYSIGVGSGTQEAYYSSPHATQPSDGELVVFNSSMGLDGNVNRGDVFVAEVPLG